MSEHIDKLREQHPELGSAFFAQLEQIDRMQAVIDSLRGGISYLIGYHERAGTVPIEKLQELLDKARESEGR